MKHSIDFNKSETQYYVDRPRYLTFRARGEVAQRDVVSQNKIPVFEFTPPKHFFELPCNKPKVIQLGPAGVS
jgi:hypothetical protein